METALYLCTGVCLILGIISLRNDLVLDIRTKIFKDVSYKGHENLPTFTKMLWDFSCWTEKQFRTKHNITIEIT